MKEHGFSFFELIIVMALLGILATLAMPNLMKQQEIAFVESSVINLLAYLELGASQSQKQGQEMHVHYIPKTSESDGCIVFNDSKNSDTSLCTDSIHYKSFKLKSNESLKVTQPNEKKPTKLFSFSPITGLPSNDLSFLLSANLSDGLESGILIRRYKGLVGCSQTGILDWQLCN